MRSKGKKLAVMIMTAAMVFALIPSLSGPAYAADQVILPAGEVPAASLEPGHDYKVPNAGTTIVLEAGDDVTVDRISTSNSNGTLTIKGADSGKLTVTEGIDMPYAGNGLIVENGILVVDMTGTNSTGWEFAITSAHYDQHGGNVTAKLSGDTGVNCGLFSNYGFHMDGGTLTALGESSDTLSFGIICEGVDNGRFVVEGGTINASAKGDSAASIRAQYLDIKGGEITVAADSTGGADGFYYGTFNGSTFTMTDGTVNMTVNGNSGASLTNHQDVTISGGQLTGTVYSKSNHAYGVDCAGQESDFTMTGGKLDITARTDPGWYAYGLRLTDLDITGGTIKTNCSGGSECTGIMYSQPEGAEMNISGTELDLTVDSTGNAYGIVSGAPINLTGGKTLIRAKGAGTYKAAYGIITDYKLTMEETEADIKAEGENYPVALQSGSADLSVSSIKLGASSSGRGATGMEVNKDLTLNGVSLEVAADCAEEVAIGINAGTGAYDWNIRDSLVEVSAASAANGAYGNHAINNLHTEGESVFTVTDSIIDASCVAPNAHGAGITMLPDLILNGETEVIATGEGGSNAHGVYVRGKLTMSGASTSIYGNGIQSTGTGYGIWANGGVFGEYEVAIPEGGVVDQGIVRDSLGGNVAEEAMIKGLTPAHLRIYGKSRYETAYGAANFMKELKEVSKLPAVIIADGRNFADALSGSYLAAVTEAPILLVHPNYEEEVFSYIQSKAETGGKVYLLGGTGAISEAFEGMLRSAGYNVKRLGGANRYDTNILILNEANSIDSSFAKELLVCSGTGFADALSASSVGKPILLVSKGLSDSQKNYLSSAAVNDAWIIGGTGAVSDDIRNELTGYVPEEGIDRLEGANRYATSLAVANEFFHGSHETAVLVYGLKFPDGLSGGAVAAKMGSPVLLCTDKETNNSYAAQWVSEAGASRSITFGGPTLIPDEQIKLVMDQPDALIVAYGQ